VAAPRLLTKHDRLLRLEKATAERQISLTDEQVRLLERFSPEFRERHIEAPHTGALVAVDTFFVGVLKGVGKLYLQTASTAPAVTVDCASRYAWARLYPNKLPVTAVQLLNVLPTFEQPGAKVRSACPAAAPYAAHRSPAPAKYRWCFRRQNATPRLASPVPQ
jgi:hypothetical protein